MTAPVKADCIRIDVVIPVYNKRHLLEETVGSVAIASEAHGAARLWIVDNGSTDGSYEFLMERFSLRATILRLPSGTISAVRNLGARQGMALILSFIDCDCLVPRYYFSNLEEVFTSGTIDATGCLVVLPPHPTWVEEVWNHMHDD